MKQLEFSFMDHKKDFNPCRPMPINLTEEDLERIKKESEEINKFLKRQAQRISYDCCPCCRKY